MAKKIGFICFALFIISKSLFSQSVWNKEELGRFYKNVKYAWGIYGSILDGYEFFCPSTSLDDVIFEIQQAKKEIEAKIDDTDAEEQIRYATGYFENYYSWIDNRTDTYWYKLVGEGTYVKAQLEGLIRDKSPHVAYLAAVTYNIFIPIYLTVRAQNKDTEKARQETIKEAIEINNILLGPYSSPETNLPIYDWQSGKLNQYFMTLSPDVHRPNLTARTNIDLIMNFVWECNDSLRSKIISDYANYKQGWFKIFAAGWSLYWDEGLKDYHGYLFVPHSTNDVVIGTPQNNNEALWRFEFHGLRSVIIIHSTGLVLDADKRNLGPLRISDPTIAMYPYWFCGLNSRIPGLTLIMGEDLQDDGWYVTATITKNFNDGEIYYRNPWHSEGRIHFVIFAGNSCYVDISHSGDEYGTANFPWNTVQEGLEWSLIGGNVLIAPGFYPENLTISKKCNLIRNKDSGSVIIGNQ